MAKPKPVPKSVVCSECGLPWSKHTDGRKTDPTPDVCIRLLKLELAKRPAFHMASSGYTFVSPGYTSPNLC